MSEATIEVNGLCKRFGPMAAGLAIQAAACAICRIGLSAGVASGCRAVLLTGGIILRLRGADQQGASIYQPPAEAGQGQAMTLNNRRDREVS
jgi:hypothetical protein